jgi:hypothetical protein
MIIIYIKIHFYVHKSVEGIHFYVHKNVNWQINNEFFIFLVETDGVVLYKMPTRWVSICASSDGLGYKNAAPNGAAII